MLLRHTPKLWGACSLTKAGFCVLESQALSTATME
jgi:hypothetical protein